MKVEGPVQPVVGELCWSNMEKQHLQQTFAVEQWESPAHIFSLSDFDMRPLS
jgi:hypothetical protein